MTKAILEIGCEEIPARFMPGLLADLKQKAGEKLTASRLAFSSVNTLGTCRRLVLVIEGLSAKQTDQSDEIKGPPAEIAFDNQGKPTPAAIGFAKKQGLTEKNLIIKSDGQKNYVYAKVVRKGLPAAAVLKTLFPELISSLYLPLAMRWGDLDFKFIRPIHWLTALCGKQIVKFELAGIKSGGQKPLPAGAIIDQAERQAAIEAQVKGLAQKAGLEAVIDPALLAEVTFLTEKPIAYLGKFDPAFLEVPQEVLITSMKKNQKYFPLVDRSGKLVAKFVVVTDGCKFKSVVEGNQKVLGARLSDARFFFEEDRKTPLRDRAAELLEVGFFDKLGNMAQKSERLVRLVQWLGQRVKAAEPVIVLAKRGAELCKVDLVTKMVYEFPELQGIMGREYARLSGEDPRAAEAIAEHYLPRFADDKLPQSPAGVLVALADRLDTLVGCFAIGAVPTGSADPYGLRRAANGLIRILSEHKIDLLLDEAVAHAAKLYEPLVGQADPVNLEKIIPFIASRLRPLLLERGGRYDVIDACLANFNDILDVTAKSAVLNELADTENVKALVVSADRVARLAKEAKRAEVMEQDLVDQAEKELFAAYQQVNWEVSEAENKENWPGAVNALVKLTKPVEKFFTDVLVMHEDQRLKTNRLALLKSLDQLYLRVADFSKVVLAK